MPRSFGALLLILSTCSCQRDADGKAAAPTVALGTRVHLKGGARAVAEGVTFTVSLLPKLIVAGPEHEIEQAQIECVRGGERAVVQIDTVHRRSDCLGLTFELGYADVYHDDVELAVYHGTGREEPAAPRRVDAPAAWCDRAHADELEEGVGGCRVDADCELSSYQEGCCAQACAASAKSRTELARARKGEDCAELKKQHALCPPPSPCPPQTHEPIAAACCAGRCITARRRLGQATVTP